MKHLKSYTKPALEIKQLYKTYGNGVQALKGIDLCVQSGDFFALLGPNGAGKSTTIGLITTLIKKTSGKISINQFDLDKEAEEAKSCLGLVPQEVNLGFFETCLQILVTQAGYYGIARKMAFSRAESLLEQLGLWEKRNTIVRHLSGGMKRRLMIARGLIHRPAVLILDEPTAGVDIEIRHSMWAFLRKINQEGTTIILTTHYLEEAERLCKHLAIINEGRIIENTSMEALFKNLRYQTFILNTASPIQALPFQPPFIAKLVNETSFELCLDKEHNFNEVFELLSRHSIEITSIRPKTNPLEELFLDIINNGQ